MKHVLRALMVVVTLVTCVGCDQAAKAVARTHLSHTSSISLLGGSVSLQLAHNDGAFLGLGASLSPRMRQGLLSVGVGCMLVALLGYTILSSSLRPSQRFAFAIIAGGGIGNLLDRLMYGGYVVDFIHMGIGPLQTGIFNVADVLICIGVGVLLVQEFTHKSLKAD